jgi:hypothetical protein
VRGSPALALIGKHAKEILFHSLMSHWRSNERSAMGKKLIVGTAICFGLLHLLQSQDSGQLSNTNNKTARSTTIAYPTPAGLQTSPVFAVKVNETEVWTEQIGGEGMEGLNVAAFSCSGPQTITVTAPSKISSYVIRPKSRRIAAKVRGREITFTIPGPQKLYLEINGLPHLAIFASPLEVNPPKEGDAGVVYFGPGTHEVGQINLQSNQTIYLAGGALVNADIRGSDLQNVRIIGRGVLHGNVRISAATNLEVNGIFIRHNGRGWANTLTDCSHGVYRDVKVFNYGTIWGTDGIDPVSCRDFTIDDCFLRCRDDCVSIKSSDANHSTDSITVKNSVMVGWSHSDGITLGFNLDGLVQNVLVQNCDILYARGQGHTGGHAAFSIVCDNQGEVRNIRFEDIRVEENIEIKNLELIVTEAQRYGQSNPRPGHVQGVYLKNIQWENADKPFVIAGIPFNKHIVEDVTFDHCRVAGKLLTNPSDADFQIEFAKDIKFIPSTKMSREILSKE